MTFFVFIILCTPAFWSVYMFQKPTPFASIFLGGGGGGKFLITHQSPITSQNQCNWKTVPAGFPIAQTLSPRGQGLCNDRGWMPFQPHLSSISPSTIMIVKHCTWWSSKFNKKESIVNRSSHGPYQLTVLHILKFIIKTLLLTGIASFTCIINRSIY